MSEVADKPKRVTARVKFDEQVAISVWAAKRADELRAELDGEADAFGWSEAGRKFQRKALASLIQAER